ncbi:MAG: ATPase [Desulfobacterales bacterium]|uniref:ATPase n=1 Tax=Candidatus Desulfaltia bathyphila TaxID=2841697 RepID=A0A8J6N5M9_9BACT|nr:ATPase [Candidatus Desulfaltia bathyphila]MBL7195004.1 ATPase [Desulfobacterales bacterium]MBL7208224.1 ATPase [Desulfobacterales bacterium]
MVSVDGSLFIQIANFIFLIWVLNVVLYKPIRKVLTQRKEKITGFEQRIDTIGKDVKEKDDAFSLGIKEARAKGLNEKGVLLQEAADEEREIIEKINKKAQANLAEIRAKIAKDVESVGKSLQQELDVFANEIGQKILGRAFE